MGRRAGIISLVFCFVILALAAYLVHFSPLNTDNMLSDDSSDKDTSTQKDHKVNNSPMETDDETLTFELPDQHELTTSDAADDDTSSNELSESESAQDDHSQKENRELLTAFPVRIVIQNLEIDAEIQPTGRDGNTMAIVPSASIISWYKLSSIPGNKGNALLAGHRLYSGQHSNLSDLDHLEIGDEMIITYSDGNSSRFLLESVFVYKLATAPAAKIMDLSGDARVTLITCKAPFNPKTGTSDYRIVAVFKEESVFVIPDPPIEPFD